MGFIALCCPKCGANIQLDDTREYGFCQYCGSKIVQEKQIIEHRGSVSIDRSQEVKNLLSRAVEMEDRQDYANAKQYYDRVLDIDINNREARIGIDNLYKKPNLIIEIKAGKMMSKNATVKIKIDDKKIGKYYCCSSESLNLSPGIHSIKVSSVYSFIGASDTFTISKNLIPRHITVTLNCGNDIVISFQEV